MDVSAVLQATAAMVLVPGGLVTLAVGLAAEWAAARFGLPGVPLITQQRSWAALAAVFSCLAAAEIAMPMGFVAANDCNLAVGAFGFLIASLCAAAAGQARLGVREAAIRGLWLLTALVPAVTAESLRPATVAVVTVGGALGLKAVCGVVYLACTPLLLGRAAAPALPSPARLWLWFPAAGLFVSEFVTPGEPSPWGLARFFGLALVSLALVLVASWAWRRLRGPQPASAPS